jgi:phosphoesterase RecJ-like protein
VLGSARLAPEAARGSGLVYTFVHRDDRIDLGSEEVESVIDIIRTTGEAAVAAVFKEARMVAGLWSVSLRSRDSAVGADDGIDVARVAAGLGGGGHQFAAGYTTRGTEDELIAALLAALDED